MKRWTTVLLMSIMIGGFYGTSYAGSKTYTLQNFKGIDVGQGLQVSIRMDSAEWVSVESDNDQFDDIELKVTNGILKIRKKMFGKHSSNPRIFVHARYIERLEASGGASIKVQSDLCSDFLRCEASSGANISAIARCKFIESKVSSGALINIAGTTQVVKIDASSGACFSGDGLSCGTAQIEASSGSSIRIKATEEIVGKVSSGASAVVEGKPANRVQCSSSGHVVIK